MSPTPAAETRRAGAGPRCSAPLGVSKADRNFIESLILFEDDELLVLNKPYGIAVQGGTKTKRHIDGMLAGMEDRFGDRPRLVHRLDRDTSGVLLVAKTRGAAGTFGKLFQTRSVQKIYWALVKGIPKPPQGKVEAALVKAAGPDGDKVRKALPGEQEVAQSAVTHYSVIDRVSTKLAWVSLKPVTGRQHQLRAHMAIIGNPIVGDQKYEGDQGLPVEDLEMKLHLHARRLIVPRGKGAPLDVTAPMPEHMLASWDMLGLDPDRFGRDDIEARHLRLRRHAGRQPAHDLRGDARRLRGERSGGPAPPRMLVRHVGLSVTEAMIAMTGPGARRRRGQARRRLSHRLRRACARRRRWPSRCSPARARRDRRAGGARDDVLLGIATGKSRRGVDRLLEREGLDGRFRHHHDGRRRALQAASGDDRAGHGRGRRARRRTRS